MTLQRSLRVVNYACAVCVNKRYSRVVVDWTFRRRGGGDIGPSGSGFRLDIVFDEGPAIVRRDFLKFSRYRRARIDEDVARNAVLLRRVRGLLLNYRG